MEDIGDINISSFQAIIENYEVLVRELSSDLDYCKSEQNNLQRAVKSLLEENKRLSKELNDLLGSKGGSSNLKIHEQDDLVENLKQQINTLISEKEYTAKLWQNSIRTIDFLEDEIKVFQAGTQGFISKKDLVKIKQSYEEKISSLESKLSATQKKLDEIETNASKDIGAKKEEIDKSLKTQTDAFKIVKNLEEEILNLQKRLQESEKIKAKVEKLLKSKEDVIETVRRENGDCKAKVREAVELVAAALNEKDAALFREKEARNDVEKANIEISNIVEETEGKIKNEVAKVKIESSLKYEQLLKDFKTAQDDISSKYLEIEKYSTKCRLLENEIEKLQRGNFNCDESKTSKLLILEKNLESTFQKLLASEKQNIQLQSEREGIKNDMEQMAGHYERALKTKEVEKLTLQNKVKDLQVNLDESNANLVRLTEKLDTVNTTIGVLEKEYHLQKQDQERILKESCATKIDEIRASCNEKLKNMQVQMEALTEVNRKWASETKFISESLEKLIEDLKAEVEILKKENKVLREQLQECGNKIGQYKKFVQLISKDVNKISDMAVGSVDLN